MWKSILGRGNSIHKSSEAASANHMGGTGRGKLYEGEQRERRIGVRSMDRTHMAV